ncbi:MAG: Hsp20/alpha crystallin family protein [Rhizobacter sp.]|nr:Hsp20/alpha crystallin family protein [Ferruginibacter sp.]
MTLVKVNNPAAKTFDGLMNDLFNDLPASFGKTFREDVFSFPPVNIVESTNAYQLEVAVPGLEKADFNIKLDGNLLTVSADKKSAPVTETEKVIRKEFSHKAFTRSFTLDEKIEASAIEAKYENGILKLTLPKKEVAKVTTKEITIQ